MCVWWGQGGGEARGDARDSCCCESSMMAIIFLARILALHVCVVGEEGGEGEGGDKGLWRGRCKHEIMKPLGNFNA